MILMRLSRWLGIRLGIRVWAPWEEGLGIFAVYEYFICNEDRLSSQLYMNLNILDQISFVLLAHTTSGSVLTTNYHQTKQHLLFDLMIICQYKILAQIGGVDVNI